MYQGIYINGVLGSFIGVEMQEAPEIISAAERGEYLEIAGRDGGAWRGDGGLAPVTLRAKLYLYEWADFNRVVGWIRDGHDVRWGKNPFFYKVDAHSVEIKAQPWGEFGGDFGWEFEVEWTAEPWRYRWPGTASLTISGTGTYHIMNPGTAAAYPIITITGSGSGTIKIGDFQASLSAIPLGGMILDCERRMAYSTDGLTMLAGSVQLTDTGRGRWPRLEVGDNTMIVAGGITQVSVMPCWRDR